MKKVSLFLVALVCMSIAFGSTAAMAAPRHSEMTRVENCSELGEFLWELLPPRVANAATNACDAAAREATGGYSMTVIVYDDGSIEILITPIESGGSGGDEGGGSGGSDLPPPELEGDSEPPWEPIPLLFGCL